MKKHFLTGLVIILPAFLTLVVLQYLINFLTKPFLGITQYVIVTLFGNNGWSTIDPPLFITLLSQGLILLALFFGLILVGFLAKMLLVNTLIKLGDKIIHNIPLASKIYKGVQEISQSIFMNDKPKFSQVVLVPFPYSNARAIGFITREETSVENSTEELVTVFLLGTPNPMMGFMLMLPRHQITPLDMPLEDAMKFVASCGVVYKK